MALQDFARSREFGERAQRWADALYFGRPGQQGSWPVGTAFGINGVGLLTRNDHDLIALLAPHKPGARELPLDQAQLIEPESDEEVVRAVRNVLPGESLNQVCILRIPQIIRNATAGTVISGAMQGTAGPRVTWGAGHTGFLTAGHVAIGTGQVYDAHGVNAVGKTIHAFDPGSGGGSTNVDVALIETPTGAALTTFYIGSPITGSSAIDLHLGKGLMASTVLALISWYVWPGIGTYVDLYMTNGACSVPGDSGAVVTSAGSKDAVGMVVGGTATFASFIQDIGRQITTLQTVTGLSALSL